MPLEVLDEWKQNRAGNSPPWQTHPWFHLREGMQIRNRLRDILKDDDLPGVQYPDTPELMHNWDDFYYGAIHELLEAHT